MMWEVYDYISLIKLDVEIYNRKHKDMEIFVITKLVAFSLVVIDLRYSKYLINLKIILCFI